MHALLSFIAAFLTLGSVGDVVTQQRPPQPSDFGGGGLRSPIYINGLTGEAFIYVNGVIAPFNSVNVEYFGADPTGVRDSTAAFQAAVAAIQSGSAAGELVIPLGNFTISAPIPISSGIRIRGVGRTRSVIQWTSTTLAAAFQIASDTAVEILGVGFSGPLNATAGCAISLAGNTTDNTHSVVRDCLFTGGWDAIVTDKAWGWTFDNNRHTGQVNRGVLVQNTLHVDFGDSTITNCLMWNMGAAATCIQQVSSGGLRVTNNKLLSGAYGYRMILAAGITTADLFFTGNSIENQTIAGIQLNTAGANVFTNVQITGNEFANQPAPIALTDATAFMSEVVITGNTIDVAAAGGTGIAITNVVDFMVASNVIRGQGGTVTGISIGSAASNGEIGVNQFKDVNTWIDNAAFTIRMPPPVLLGMTAVASSLPADAAEHILATFKYPKNGMGKNGRLVIQALMSQTNSGNTKTIRVRAGGIGGQIIGTIVSTAADTTAITMRANNKSVVNAQLCWASAESNGPYIAAGALATTFASDTDLDIVVTGQKQIAGETMSLGDASCYLQTA